MFTFTVTSKSIFFKIYNTVLLKSINTHMYTFKFNNLGVLILYFLRVEKEYF